MKRARLSALAPAIKLFVDHAPDELGKIFPEPYPGQPGNCIGSTAVAVKTFRRLGFAAFEIATSAIATAPNGKNQVGVGPESGPTLPGEEGVDLHLVAVLGGQYLVDAAPQQFNRPWYGIKLPPVIVATLDDDDRVAEFMRGETWLSGMFEKTKLEYRRQVGGRSSAYLTAPDWLNERGQLEGPVVALVDLIRKRLRL